MVSSVTSHEKDCHFQYSRSHVASFSHAMKRSLHLLRYLFSCSITLQGTSFFLMFNLPCSNPWPWPLAIMPVATTTQNLVLPSLWLFFKQLYKTATASTFTLSSGLTNVLLPRTSLNLRDVSTFWCPDTLCHAEKRLYSKGKQRHLAWWTESWHGWQHFLSYSVLVS